MNTVARTLGLAALILAFASPALAQGDARSIGRPDSGLAAIPPEASLVKPLPPIQVPQRRADSLWKGDARWGWFWRGVWRAGRGLRGVGAGIGGGIDALRRQRSTVPRVLRPSRRVMVASLVGKQLRAVVGSVRF